ncbi:MAG TPA: DUF3488 and transglutaminase-like domain-containing protein [Longimicrobiales bacterium]
MTAAALRVARVHRRLTIGMALAALAAFAAGAGLPFAVSAVTGALLVAAFLWQPSKEVSMRIERAVLLVTVLLVLWTLYQVFIVTDDIVAPVVALLLVLLTGEALRSLDARNDARLYALSFALLVASTAYLPGVVFAAAFIVFVVVTTLALMTGHIRREAERHGAAMHGLDRTLIRSTIALSLITLSMGALVFLAFPRLPRNIFGRGITTPGVRMAGFGDEVSIGEHGSRIYSNPEVVLRVEFVEDDSTYTPRAAEIGSMYWRGRSFDEFDGVRWSRNSRMMPRAWPPLSWYAAWEASGTVRQPDQRIFAGALDARVLFGLHPIIDVAPRSDFRPAMDAVGDLSYFTTGAPIYVVRSGREAPPVELLRRAVPGPAVSAPAVARGTADRLDQVAVTHYLQLPRLSVRMRALADSLTRGRPTQYDRVVAIESWLRTNFSYTLDLPATREQATLDYFLFERRAGHCEYFSTALVVLLRSVGIPARNVTGFMGGEWNEFGRYLAVTQNDAHSWVEVWFSGVGWVAFDATPAGGTAALADRSDFFSPFRNFFGGMQHRWSKWVIDYDLDRQIQLFSQVGDLFSREPRARQQTEKEDGGAPAPWRYIVFGLAGAAVLLAAYRIARRRGPSLRPESRLYLAARRAFARSGWDDAALVRRRGGRLRESRDPVFAPLEWVSALRAAGAPAADAAELVTRRYLDARFGGRTLASSEIEALRARIGEIRSALGRRSKAG